MPIKMKKRRLFALLFILGATLASCGFKDEKKEIVWSKWHDNGDGTHSRHDLSDITNIQTEPHTFTLKQVLVEPTDVAPGKEVYKCDLCGATENRDVPPTGNYVFDQEVVDDKYLYEKCSEHSAIYYKSSVEGAYGNPNCLFEHSDVGSDYTEVEYIESDGSQFVDTGVENTNDYLVSYNNETAIKNIPTSYQRVEYLRSDGLSYIDTGFYANEKSAIEVDGDLEASWDNPYSLYGTRNGYNLTCGSYNIEGYFYYLNRGVSCSVPPGTKRAVFKQDGPKVYVNGEQIYEFENVKKQESDPIYLFGRCHQGQLEDAGHVKIYYAKIWDSGVLVRHYIPCFEKGTGILGMYELVQQKFCPNKGNGSFEKGDNVYQSNGGLINLEYTQLQYLTFTGTQCVNTLVNGNNLNLKIVCTYQVIDESQSVLFAARVDNTAGISYWPFGYAQFGTVSKPVTVEDITATHTVELSKDGLFLDGSKLDYQCGDDLVDSDLLIGMTGIDTRTYKGDIYSFRIYDGSTLIRDMIPVKNNSNNQYGFYDSVTEQFFGDERGTEFVPGPVADSSTTQILPSGYQQVEYIETTGTQYIDTEFCLTTNSSYEISFELTSTAHAQGIMGVRNGQNDTTCQITSWQGNIMVQHSPDDLLGNVASIPVDTNRHTVKNAQGAQTIDGVKLADDSISNDSALPLYIGARNGVLMCASAKYYSMKIWDSGALVRDYIPCYRTNDSVVGMFDIANGRFYTNSGEGDFTKGPNYVPPVPNSLPSIYQEVSYIESDGYEYIDTGVRCHLTDTIDTTGVYHFLEENASAYTGANWYAQLSAPKEVPALRKVTSTIHTEDHHSDFFADGELYHQRDWNDNMPDNVMFAVFKLGDDDGQIWGNEIGPKMKLYSLSISVNEVKVRDFVPCFRKSDEEIGLYDLVSDTFFTNEGSGSFKKGENVNGSIAYEDFSDIEKHDLPESYHQLAYARAYGSVQINTGVTGKSKLELIGGFSKVSRNQFMGYSSEEMLCFGVDSSNKYFGTDITPGAKDTIIFDCGETNQSKGSLSINGTEVVNVDLQSFPNLTELKLFSLGDNNGCYFKFYEAKVYQSGSLVRHFIPAKDIYFKLDGLYDLVEGKFYQSSTANNLDCGSDLDLPAYTSHINMFISRFSNEKITQTGQINNCKIYNSENELYREFVPVIRNSDGKPGFYELKENKFYTNDYGNEFNFGKKVGHHFDEGVVERAPTHDADGSIVYTCSICGRKVHEKLSRLSYKVEFKVPDFVRTIRVFSEVDPSKYDESLIGYTRNIATYNYSKTDAMIYFEVMTTQDVELIVTASNGNVKHVEGNRYRVTNIKADCIINVSAK